MINITKGSPIKVNCPNPDKFPTFSKAFNGARGKVSSVHHTSTGTYVRVHIPTKDQENRMITVRHEWLSHD